MEMTCTIDGCTKKIKARGWCAKHYERVRRHGDPNIDFSSTPKCGTSPGYYWHRRNGEAVCEPCRTAMNEYNQKRRADQRAVNQRATVGNCDTCELPMVARSTPHTHVPAGHRKAQNETTCKRCYDAALRAEKRGQVPVKPHIVDDAEEERRHKATLEALGGYMRQRQARIERAKQLAIVQAKYGRAA